MVRGGGFADDVGTDEKLYLAWPSGQSTLLYMIAIGFHRDGKGKVVRNYPA